MYRNVRYVCVGSVCCLASKSKPLSSFLCGLHPQDSILCPGTALPLARCLAKVHYSTSVAAAATAPPPSTFSATETPYTSRGLSPATVTDKWLEFGHWARIAPSSVAALARRPGQTFRMRPHRNYTRTFYLSEI